MGGGCRSGDEADLDGLLAGGDHVQALLEVLERELVGADLVQREFAGLDQLDGGRPAVRAEVCTQDVELLVVGDDRPVDRDVLLEDRVLHVAAELAQQVEALRDGRGVPGALQVDVGAVATGEVLDDLDRILFGDVDRHRRAGLLGDLQLARIHVEGDDPGRRLRCGTGDHAEADRAGTGHHHGVVEADVRPLDGVQGAGQRLGERGVGRRDVLADPVHQGVGADHHVLLHAARVGALEAVHVVRLAHVVIAVVTVEAVPARDDLLQHDPVVELDPPVGPRLVIQADDPPGDLVPRDDLGLGPGRPVLIAPELRRTGPVLQVAGADTHRLDLEQQFPGPAGRHRQLLQAVVARPVIDDCLHRLGKCVVHL
ncbi:hypothetical protein SDC9_119754 [bioreactor metagenome]|uniref:Uncharacterized protein n=1 Tax=bioreactor metagenome TaxID=1076179 RepID=A0A645C5Y3_9ZZZZ